MQGIGAGGKIDGWAHRSDGRKRSAAAPLASEFEHQIAAHRIANERDAAKVLLGGKVVNDSANIARERGVVKSGGQIFGIAAVAHVHADDVEASGKGTRGEALNIARVGGAFETMHQHHGQPLGADRFGLPINMAEDATVVTGIDEHGDDQ